MLKQDKGMSLIEIIIATSLMCVLVIVLSVLLHAVLSSWSSSGDREDIAITLDRGVEETKRDLREAKEIGFINSNEIRFSQDLSTYYIYYFYNSNDIYPPSFSQNNYQFKKAQLTGGLNSPFTYGDGRIILAGLFPNPDSTLTVTGNIITIDLKIFQGDEALRAFTKVRPRNL